MGKLFFTSDLHFNHDREFIYQPRGYNGIAEMNQGIINNWNSVVSDDDTVYVLGDLMLGGFDSIQPGLDLIKQLKGHIHVIIGNHDTDNRINAYKTLENITSVEFGNRFKYQGRSFFLSHYPTEVSNLDSDAYSCTINLHGHTHSKEKFNMGKPYQYNVALDAHNCFPVDIEEIIKDFWNEVDKCKKQL